MNVPLGKVKDTTPKGVTNLTEKETVRFFYTFFTSRPDTVARIKDLVDFDCGAPRHLTVEAFLAVGIASAIHGELHVTNITRTALTFNDRVQRDLGLVTVRQGKTSRVTDRKIDHLFGAVATAFKEDARTIRRLDDGLWVDTDTGELFDKNPLNDTEIASLEEAGNLILAALWEYIRIPEANEYALDSMGLETHYAPRSYGGKKDVDPVWVAAPDQADAVGGRASTAKMKAKHQEWAANAPPEPRDPKSRKPRRIGPTIDGDFSRRDPQWPQVADDGRVRHTIDTGAATAYSGSGSSTTSKFVEGRDKHTIVSSGHLPDGSAYPPLLRAYRCVPGGYSRTEAALRCLAYMQRAGFTADGRWLSQDRIYTGVKPSEYEHPVTDLGWKLVKGLTARQKTCQPWSEGVILLDGYWFTDGTPEGIRDLEPRPIGATSERLAAIQETYDERAAYAFHPRGTTKAGNPRFYGPAVPHNIKRNRRGRIVGASGITVRCPNSKYANFAPADAPVTTCTPGTRCGCSKTITVKRDEMPSSYMQAPYLYGTTKWARKYAQRSNVEAFNANEKHHYRFERHSIRVRGDKWTLAHLMLTLATWLKLFRNWVLRKGAYTIDRQKYPGGPLNLDVIAAVIARVTCTEVPAATDPPPGTGPEPPGVPQRDPGTEQK